MQCSCIIGVLSIVGCALAAQGQEVPLRLSDLVAEALVHNPEVLAMKERYEAARQRPPQEGSLPDPVFSPAYSSIGEPWPGAGLGIWQVSHVGFRVSQELPFLGKRKLRSEIASKEAEVEYHDYNLVRLRVISRLKQTYHQLQYTYAAIDILSRNREVLRKLLNVAQVTYISIRGAQEAELSSLEARLLRMERDKHSQEAEINSLLDRDPSSPLARPVDMNEPPPPAMIEEWLIRAQQNAPELLRERKMVEREELAARLARRQYWPDYRVSAGYFNMGSMPSLYEFSIDVNVPVYFRQKQRVGVTEQLYALNQARHNYQAVNRALGLHIKNEHLRAETSFRLAKMYKETVIPQAKLAVESSLASYEAGAVDIMSFLSNYTLLVQAEMTQLDEMLNIRLALARLEELTGALSPDQPASN